ncbi:MAG: right-handed parallel beta-helix repeat-containing protein [Candidatus Thermoplasmatota archaeon]|nr:right-handed parallel beta-helix repeat-containing protein [Candidatus Thermoplasmatota archaeon]
MTRGRTKIGIIIGIAMLVVTATVASGCNTTLSTNPHAQNRGWLYVGGTGFGNYSTIQEAIDASSNGDTIFVYNKTYNENVDTKLKKITLMGENKETTVIQGVTVDPVVKIGTSDVTLTGFTLIGGVNVVVVQVASLAQNVQIANNIIEDGAYGISLGLTSSNNYIQNNVIMNCEYIGLQLETSSYNLIQYNTIDSNSGQGISLSLSSNHNSLKNNSIINNGKEGILINGVGSTENTIKGNNISGNEVNIRFSGAGSNTITNNIIQGSLREGVLLATSKENTITMNNFIDNSRQATFKLSSRNTWDENYWSNWIGFKLTKPLFQKLPKVILGFLGIAFDRHPAQEPYNITVMI